MLKIWGEDKLKDLSLAGGGTRHPLKEHTKRLRCVEEFAKQTLHSYSKKKWEFYGSIFGWVKLKFDGIKEIRGCSSKSGKRHLFVLNIVSGAVLCEVLGINVHTGVLIILLRFYSMVTYAFCSCDICICHFCLDYLDSAFYLVSVYFLCSTAKYIVLFSLWKALHCFFQRETWSLLHLLSECFFSLWF